MIPLIPSLALSAALSAGQSPRIQALAMWADETLIAAEESAPLSALVWWLIPLAAFIGSIMYVIWVTKFQSRYQNETNRSVGRFQRFQESLDKDRGRSRDSQEVHTPASNESDAARNPQRHN